MCYIYPGSPKSAFVNLFSMSAIRVQNLCKKYGETEALKEISFEVDKGEIVGFLGPNGAGKTTTMKILTCFMSANSGEAWVAGHDCFKESIPVRQKIGYLPENNPLYWDMTVYDYLRYMAELHNVPGKKIPERVKEVIAECGLGDRVFHAISTLSKGYRQRVGLAASLVHDPEILILDEPTVGLDPNQIVEIRHLIQKLGKEKTVIVCSHNLAEVELTCNRIIIISQGKIVAEGTPAELRGLVEGHANIRLSVRGDKKGTEAALKKVKGVKNVVVHPGKGKDIYDYELITVKNRDLREDVVSAVIEGGFKLVEIHREAVSLEEIFNQVTK